MFHRQVLLNFFQQDLEPLHNAWWRVNLRSFLMAYAAPQELGLKMMMVSSLSTKEMLMKPTICWKTWPNMIIELGLVQGTTKVGKAIHIISSHDLAPKFKISWRPLMRYLFEELR